MSITIDEDFKEKAKIKVIGVGGAGCNALNGMIEEQNEIHGVEFIAINTDSQSLNKSNADLKIQIGQKTTQGLGAGAKPEVGAAAAEENIEEIKENIEGADMVIITAGMGGGTGTGAAPVIAKAAKEMGILTVSVATTPFVWEGPKRSIHAKQGVEKFTEHSDSIIVISNNKIQASLSAKNQKPSLMDGFKEADRVLKDAVSGISSLIQEHGIINLDFSDVRTIMNNGGRTYIGIGYGSGENKVENAVNSAIHDILLDDVNIQGAENALIQVILGETTGFEEMGEIQEKIYSALADDNVETNMINGVMMDPTIGDSIRVLVIATSLKNFEPILEKKVAPKVVENIVEPTIVKPIEQKVIVETPIFQPEVKEEIKTEEIKEDNEAPQAIFAEEIEKTLDPTTDDIIDSILMEEDEEEFSTSFEEEITEKEIQDFNIPLNDIIEEENKEEEETLFTLDNISMDSSNNSTDFPPFLRGDSTIMGNGSAGKKIDRKIIIDMYDDRKNIPAFLRKMMD